MLSGGLAEDYRTAIAVGGGRLSTRVEVWLSGQRIDPFGEEGLPLLRGSLSATLQNRITRTVTFEVPERDPRYRNGASMLPINGGDLLDPLGSEIRISASWRFGSKVYGPWPLFRGPVSSVFGSTRTGSITVRAEDLAELIVADNLTHPRSATVANLVTAEFMDLVDDTIPDAVFGSFDETYTRVAPAVWDSDRAGALDSLASSADSFWYALADGSFVMRQIPWALPTPPAQLVTFSSDDPAIRFIGVDLSRDQVANTVVVSSTSGGNAAFGVASDIDPDSRTYIYGPLGSRVLRVSGVSAVNNAQAYSIAASRLIRVKSAVETWSCEMTADPTLELGDWCELVAFGQRRTVALTGFTFPLTGSSTMTSMSWRPAGGVL